MSLVPSGRLYSGILGATSAFTKTISSDLIRRFANPAGSGEIGVTGDEGG